MMLRINIVIVIFTIFACLVSCKKFYSYEGGFFPVSAKGTLKDSSGNCSNIVINGSFIKDNLLTSGNTIIVYANITQPGKFVLYTDTVNGYYFRDTGSINNTGLQSFTLKGFGTPVTTQPDYFTVHFDSSFCNFIILPGQAKFIFNAPAGTCTTIKVNGAYKAGTPLNNADTVSVPISVLIPGTYNVQTTAIDGMVYTSKGTFVNTGSTMLTLKGSGIPFTAGNITVPVTISTTNCSFIVNVSSKVIDTTQFWKFTAEGVDYKGYEDSIYSFVGTLTGHPTDTIHSIEFFGIFPDSLAATNSLTFQFDLDRINHDIVTGNYHPALVADFKDFYGDIFYYNSITNVNYNISTSLQTFTINLDTYDLNTRLMHCTFSGPVINGAGQVVNITNGEVRAYLAY
ncbi:hypothetical protein [Ferruginibacter sp.]|uniref:hypothetical protein n=1 Tax=Ferruginibacter sp. TaxID=1940288 RepID=UPI00265B0D90|nr:hypothetical protein [Ferruginibacter sp.]